MSIFQKISAFFFAIFTFFNAVYNGNISVYFKNHVYISISYGDYERNQMDLYIPKHAQGKELGMILMIHGGAWIMGNKDGDREAMQRWANKGYVAAGINYHYISDEFHIDDILDDITLALTKTNELCAKKGVKVKNVLLTGSSAGGHLSLLYAYARAEKSPIPPAAVVDFCGPTKMYAEDFIFDNCLKQGDDTSEMENLISMACGQQFTRETYAAALPAMKAVSPVEYVNENTVPTVMCYGLKDDLVLPTQGAALDEKLNEYGVPHDVIWYPNSGHGLDCDPDCSAEANRLFELYVQTYLGDHA